MYIAYLTDNLKVLPESVFLKGHLDPHPRDGLLQSRKKLVR